MSYTQSIERLETIVRQIESGETDIDTLTKQLSEAKQLVNQCRKQLTTIEQEVQQILTPTADAPNVKET